MVSVLRDWKTLALIEVRAPKYFVCHPKITPCPTGINPKQAFACFQSKHAHEQSRLYINICMGKTSTAGILSGVGTNDFGGIISAEAYHQKLRPNFSLMDQDPASVCQIEGSYIHPLCMSGEKTRIRKDHNLRSDKRYICTCQSTSSLNFS